MLTAKPFFLFFKDSFSLKETIHQYVIQKQWQEDHDWSKTLGPTLSTLTAQDFTLHPARICFQKSVSGGQFVYDGFFIPFPLVRCLQGTSALNQQCSKWSGGVNYWGNVVCTQLINNIQASPNPVTAEMIRSHSSENKSYEVPRLLDLTR